MVFSKSLLIKGLLAFVAVGGGGVVIFRKQLGLVKEEIDELGIPKSCGADQVTKSGEQQKCQLTSDQLKKIKFKNFDGKTGDVTVDDLDGKVELTISWENTKGSYTDNKKYTFYNTKDKNIKISQGEAEVKIFQRSKTWFRNENGKLTIDRAEIEEQKKKKMNEINGELTKLGFGFQLEIKDFDQEDRIDFKQIEKTLTESDLKKIKFKELNNETPETVECEKNCQKSVDLVLYYTTDSTKYPKNMKFLFKNKNAKDSNKDITLKREDKTVIIYSLIDTYIGDLFKNSDGKLEEVTS